MVVVGGEVRHKERSRDVVSLSLPVAIGVSAGTRYLRLASRVTSRRYSTTCDDEACSALVVQALHTQGDHLHDGVMVFAGLVRCSRRTQMVTAVSRGFDL